MLGQLRIGIKNGLYAIIAVLCFVALKVFFRVQVRGRHHIHESGEYIAIARHRSYWDIPVLAIAVGIFTRVHFIARKGLMRGNPIVQPVIRTFATIIDRDNFSRGDFRKMLEAMRRERIIGLFPEGTTKKQVDAKTGAVHFAKLTGKQFLPVNITSRGPYPPEYPFRFPRLTVSIGEPFSVDDICVDDETRSRTERYQLMSEQVMLRVDNA